MNKRSPSENGRLPHEVVADTLRERIRSGELLPGARLPSQKKLVTEFEVNRNVVRQALEALAHEGLLHSRGRGAPPTVASTSPSQEEPQYAGTELAERLYEAFQAEHVTVDAYCLTTETLNNALAEPRRAIIDGELSPRSVTVRVILPSQEAHLALPRHVDDPADPRPLERLHEIQSTYSHAMALMLNAMRHQGYVPEVSFELRTVPATPLHKLYLLNGTEALTGWYEVVEQEVEYRGEMMAIYDVLGINTKLFHTSARAEVRTEQEAAYVQQSQAWFESLWSTVAAPADPSTGAPPKP